MKRIAVFAHYDKDGRLSSNTLRLLSHLEGACERVIMVSTNLLQEEIELLSTKVECHVRENIGYDFYSYKYGIEKIGDIFSYDELLLINDSFFVSSSFNINSILNKINASPYDICGLVDSYQFHYHVQTFFVVLKKEALLSVWFRNFWDNVSVLDTKIEIIFKYEIGLSQSALSHSLMVGACFQWEPKSYYHAFANCFKSRKWRLVALSFFSYKYLREGNACHLLWEEIYNEFSVCKWEVIRTYPEVREYLSRYANSEDLLEVDAYLDNKAYFYADKKIDDVLIDSTPSLLNSYSPVFLQNKIKENRSIAVVVHLFYLELLDEIMSYLKNIPRKFDLFISVVSISSAIEVEKRLKHFNNANIYVYCVKNQGRDVAPFISLLNTGVLSRYKYVCKIHSKKSLYSVEGSNWRRDIFNELLGSPSKILSILHAFESYSNLGIIGPEKSYLSDDQFWGANKEKVRELSLKVGIDENDIYLGFFAGTMFWFNPKAIEVLKSLKISVDDFEPENGVQDGSLAHAIERIFVLFSRHSNYKVTSVERLESEVLESDYYDQRVPVL